MLNCKKNYIFIKLIAAIILISPVFISLAKAQEKNNINSVSKPIGKIKGKIIDPKGKPIELTSVYIVTPTNKSSNIGTYTDSDGFFYIENIKPGKYQVIASFIGYENFQSKEININSNNSNIDLGLITLKDSNKKLEDVVVTDEKKLIEVKTDRIVYKAEKDVTNSGGSASDVLRKVPLVNVDAEGNVDLRGNSDILVMVNGKPSPIFTNNLSEALEMLPADQIKKVEVITTPSAKYGSEGSKGIINIITESDTKYSGINGNINLAVGKRSRASSSINYYYKKFSASLMLSGYGSFKTKGSYSFDKEIFNEVDDTKYINTFGDTFSRRLGAMPFLTLNYDFDDKNTLTSTLMVANRKNFNNNNVNQDLLNIDRHPINQRYSESDKEKRTNGIDWTLSYVKKFNDKQELNIDYETSNNWSNYDLITNTFSNSHTRDLLNKSFSDNQSKNTDNSLQVFYLHPITKTIKIEMGAKATLRTISTDYNYKLYKDQDLNSIISSLNNNLNFQQNIYAGYLMFNYDINTKTSLILGSRLEHTYNNATFLNSGDKNYINNRYNNLMPSLAIIYKLTEMSSVKLNYRRGIYRPTIKYINPYEDRTDSLNIKKGNPNLSPENNDLFELGYNILFKDIPIADFKVFYERTNNTIEPVTKNINGGSSLTTYENIGTQTNLGISLLSSYRFFKTLTIRGELSLFTSKYSNLDYNNLSSNNNISYRASLITSYSLINNLSAEMFFIFNSSKHTAQGTRPSFTMLSLGIRKTFTKSLSINLALANPFKENIDFITETKTNDFYQISRNSIPFRFIILGLRYKFGKLSQIKVNKNKNNDIFSDNKESSGTDTNF